MIQNPAKNDKEEYFYCHAYHLSGAQNGKIFFFSAKTVGTPSGCTVDALEEFRCHQASLQCIEGALISDIFQFSSVGTKADNAMRIYSVVEVVLK